jgi:DNA-binding MarR family transcriptional regulator
MKKDAMNGIVKDLLSLTPLIRRSIQRKLVRTAFSQIEEDITLPHLEILKTLHTEGTKHIAEIGEKLQIPKPQMTHLIDRLEKIGVVARQPDANDRRIINIALTAKGNGIINEFDATIESYISDKLSALTDDELQELSSSLRKLASILSKI